MNEKKKTATLGADSLSRLFDCGNYTVKTRKDRVTVAFDGEFSEKEFSAVPVCDFFGNSD